MNPDTLLTVVAEVRAKRGKEAELRGVLTGLVGPTRKEEGCVQYILHVDNQDPGHFVFYETWKSTAHLETHVASPHMRAFASRQEELLAEPLRVVLATRVL
jgi:quinol monooxygenase YgiN